MLKKLMVFFVVCTLSAVCLAAKKETVNPALASGKLACPCYLTTFHEHGTADKKVSLKLTTNTKGYLLITIAGSASSTAPAAAPNLTAIRVIAKIDGTPLHPAELNQLTPGKQRFALVTGTTYVAVADLNQGADHTIDIIPDLNCSFDKDDLFDVTVIEFSPL
jgi:hypothetical protein